MGRSNRSNKSAGEASGKEVAKTIYDRKIHSVEQALKVAQQNNISRSETDVPAEQLPDSELFLLGRPMLQARLEKPAVRWPGFRPGLRPEPRHADDAQCRPEYGPTSSDLSLFANA